MVKCGDCGVEEGELHMPGCDMERCLSCGGQLISCACTDKQVNAKGYRIPWVSIPLLCRLCGKKWPDFFRVSDDEWQKHVPPTLQRSILCDDCYSRMKALFPNGWKNAPSHQNEAKKQ